MNGLLAIYGGRPLVSRPPRPWSWPPLDAHCADMVRAYIAEGKPLSIKGRDGIIAECEDELARRFNQKYAVLCSSGTMALYSAYFALGIEPGDEVIATTVTYHATATPALHLGAKVVLVDVEPDTGNISVDAVAAAITPRTRAVASNAMWGHPVAQQALRDLCNRHHIAWVEDVSHAHFAQYRGRPVGSFGDIACASLQGPKLITGGEGGVLVTSNPQFHLRSVLLGHNLDRSTRAARNTIYEPIGHSGYGLKLRCHPLAALIIHHQLVQHADRWVAQRHTSLTRLGAALARLPGLEPPTIRPYVTSMGAWYGYKPRVDVASLGVSRAAIVEALQAEGIEVDIPGSKPLHQLALFDPERFRIGGFDKHDNRQGSFPHADTYAASTLSLPTFTGPADDERLDATVAGFEKVWRHLDELRAVAAGHRQ